MSAAWRPTTTSYAPADADGHELVASPAEVRAMDKEAIGRWGVPGIVLMELAGQAAASAIRERLGGLPGKAVVLCGTGNNGGDGYVVARHLHAAGFSVRVVALGEPKPRSDAELNHASWMALVAWESTRPAPRAEHRLATRPPESERGAVTARMRHWLGHANVIIDALFGTGLARALDADAADLVMAANEAGHGLKVALDLPSGLDGHTGEALGPTFFADLTVTFGLMKRGLLLRDGPASAGEVVVADIGWPGPVLESTPTSLRRCREAAVAGLVPSRREDGHKGSFGHVGVLGGASGLEGAAVLAARGAMRSGSGLVTWLAPAGSDALTPTLEAPRDPARDTSDTTDSGAPMTTPDARPAELMRATVSPGAPLPSRPGVLVVGPGLGTSETAAALCKRAWSDPRPAVFDADALNLLASGVLGVELAPGVMAVAAHGPRVLTPHPLEAARLLGVGVDEVQADRVGAATRLAERFPGAAVVLKGARTLVAVHGAPVVLVDLAEPTLAVGGTGDVLAGLIGGLLAQGLSPREAALLGVWVHAHAGREAGLGQGRRGALASEIADRVPAVMGLLEAGR